jgi:type II secretory pathway pseudopilin PulG
MMPVPQRQQTRTRGFSLTEIAIVLGVAGIVIGGIWTIARSAMESMRVQEAEQELTIVVQNIRDYYAGQAGIPSNSPDMITAQLAAAGVFPGHMLRTDANCHQMPGLPRLCPDAPWGSLDIVSGNPDTIGTFFVCDWFSGYSGGWCGDFPPSNPPIQQFGVEIEDPPPASCERLAIYASGPSGPKGLVDVWINGSSMLALGHGLPVQPQDARTYCSAIPKGNGGVAMVFVYNV